MKLNVLAAGFALLAACTAPESGVRSPADFNARARQTEVASRRPALTVARCFQDQATLLPFSAILTDPDGKGATYRLRGYGYSFEEIRFRPAARGSVSTVLVAPGLNSRSLADLERDRLSVLRACAG